MESLSLPSALTQQAMEDAKLTDEDIRIGDEAVEAALETAERGFKLPEALRSQLLDRLDLEAKVPLYDSAIAGLSGGSMAPGSNAGLKHFTLRLAEIIEKSRTTTYSDLADTLLADLNTAEVQAEEKNVRRRVYDALNVLEAIGCVQKGSKLIEWIGWPSELNRAGTGLVTGETAVARMFARRDDMLRRLTSRIERSQQQAVKLLCLCNLIKRNKDAILPLLVNAQRRGFDAPNPFPVPFMMVLAPESAKTDVYISEDARHAEIVFNDGVRYDVYDDCGVLQLMGLGEPSPACLQSVLTAEEE